MKPCIAEINSEYPEDAKNKEELTSFLPFNSWSLLDMCLYPDTEKEISEAPGCVPA